MVEPTQPGAPRLHAADNGSAPRIAIVHDWLTGMRGGEKVLEALCETFPEAALFTMVHLPGSVSPGIERHRPRSSLVSRLPMVGRYYRRLLPVFPFVVEQFDLDGFDLIISSSHCAVKSVVRTGRARHVCYCHTPMRYAWDQFGAYFGRTRVGPIGTTALGAVMTRLARWDAETATRVDRFLANSRHVAGRIRRYYNRGSRVIYPPVDTAFFRPDGPPSGEAALIVSALVPYKRIDVAMDASARAGLPLRIAGHGPELDRLRRTAGSSVTFLGSLSDEELRAEYRRARLLLLPGEEDFGIVPVEAQACGRPVVAYGRGGALETVVDGVTGVLVGDASVEAFAEGIRRALGMPFDADRIRRHARQFARDRFVAEMRSAVDEILSAKAGEVRW